MNPQEHEDIRAALDALARAFPAAAGRAATALRLLLRRAYSTGSWSFSRLTGDGFPLEVAFRTGHNEICYTADPGGDGVNTAERLQEAVKLLAELRQPHPDESVLGYLLSCQASGSHQLRYGAWLGGRHGADGGERPDRYKLYAEVPRCDLETHLPFLMRHLDVPERGARSEFHLAMVGLEPCTGRLEFYFRRRDLELTGLPLLLEPAGVRSRGSELLEFIEKAYGYPLRGRIPGGSVGVSYAVTPGSDTISFTLFLFTRLIWGGDARIRERFAERLHAAGVDPSPYQELTAPLAARDIYQTYHGLLGFSLSPGAAIQLSLGVRPPPISHTPEV